LHIVIPPLLCNREATHRVYPLVKISSFFRFKSHTDGRGISILGVLSFGSGSGSRVDFDENCGSGTVGGWW